MVSVGAAAAYNPRIITSTYTLDGNSLGPFGIRREGLFGGIESGIEERVD